jgi:hypothetical protein
LKGMEQADNCERCAMQVSYFGSMGGARNQCIIAGR